LKSKRAIGSRSVLGVVRPAAVAVVLAFSLANPGGAGSAFAQGPASVADLAEQLTGSVVNISTAQNVKSEQTVPFPSLPPGTPFQDFFEDFLERQQRGAPRTPRKVQSLGSGFVIDEGGLIVTNNHVITDADEIEAIFPDGTKLKAEVVGRDSKTDLAVLKVTPTKPLKAVKFGNSDTMRVGDWVMAIGNPFGLGGSVSIGIISARDRDINSGPYDSFLQTDAAINRGNSGGPLFNMAGEVIGINTAIISPTGGSIGIGFAVPASNAAPVIAQLREFGETRRGWLGVRIQTVTDEIAESLALPNKNGALVADVTKGGPAEPAGIEAGDIITKFDGKDVVEMRDLPRLVADTVPDKTVDVIVVRKGKEMTLQVKVGRLEESEKTAEKKTEEPAPEPTKSLSALGLSLSDLTEEAREQYKIDKQVSGVVVTEVEGGSAAAEKQIAAGEVIVEVNQEQVRTPQDVLDRIEVLKKAGRKSVLLTLAKPDGELRFVPVRVDG
jgi:serine protease Do